MKKMIGFFTIAIVSFSSLAMSQNSVFDSYGIPLPDLDQAKKALQTGAVVTASIDLDKCTLSTGQKSRNLAGGLIITNFLIERDGTLRFSSFRTTLSSRADVAVTQNNKYRVSEDGDVTFTSSVFSMPDYSLISKVDVFCKMNESFFFYADY